VRLSVIGQLVRRRWQLLAVLAAVGAVLGAGASLLLSPGYESTSNVLLQGPRDEEELVTEAQIAMSSIVLDRTATALGGDGTGGELRGSVGAEVLDGNVIAISGSAGSPERARQLTERLTQEYITFSAQLVSGATDASAQVLAQRRETLEQRVAESSRRIEELQGPDATAAEGPNGELERLQSTLADAITELDDIEGRTQGAEADAAFARASIVVMEPASRPSGPAPPTLVQLIAGGALLSFVLGVFGLLAAARADRRLCTAPDIAAALGSHVLGSVDVPDGSTANPDVRYRRVLARLRGAPDTVLRLLVLVADDDTTAQRAAAQLAVAAEADGAPASVMTDSADVSRMLQAATESTDSSSLRRKFQPGSNPATGAYRTVLRIVHVCAARPTVPDCGRLSGALVVVTAGTRTPWELVGIAEACADAGHRVIGAFVTHRTDVPASDPAPTGPPEGSPHGGPSSNGKAMAGSP
jgi:capsular polysaccharide biosynthesis protein